MVIMEDGLVKINSVKQNMKIVMTGYEDGKMLRMKGTIITRNFDFARATSTNISPIRFWHVRYGYLNFERLSQLQKPGMVKGLPTFKKNLLSLVTIRQAGHMVIMEDGLVKINSVRK